MAKVFSQSFIEEQARVFKVASERAGEHEALLNPSKTSAIMDYLRQLRVDERDYEHERRTYYGLLKLIYDTKNEFKQKNSSIFTHPYVAALDKIKENIMIAVEASHPRLQKKHEATLAELKGEQSYAKALKAFDALSMFGCGLWAVPQMLITLGNCGGDADCRPDPQMGPGDIACCHPIQSIRNLKAEYNQLDATLEEVRPQIMAMKR